MKYFVISDIHGCITYLEKAINIYKESDCNKILLLGDLLNHGPRNPMFDEYNPEKVSNLLNKYKKEIIAVRGNCDSEVDEMVLDFKMMNDYAYLVINKQEIYVTHGHLENNLNNLDLNDNVAYIHGHFHVPRAEKINNNYILNPGSITYPKDGYKHSFGILEEKSFKVYDLDKNIIKEIEFK